MIKITDELLVISNWHKTIMLSCSEYEKQWDHVIDIWLMELSQFIIDILV